jgi:NAD(P)-dependent dehydrogenase (short-subunit alcohol dehydrogenase family)
VVWVLALTKSAAQEYAAHGIRVNALVAGGFDTEMLQTAVSRAVGGDPAKAQEAFKGYAARVPAGRVGRPEEAAEAVLWLCSEAASYVTGQSMIVDGGLAAWRALTKRILLASRAVGFYSPADQRLLHSNTAIRAFSLAK